MDLTPKYIKMCERAKRNLGIPSDPGSFWYDLVQKRVFVVDDMKITHLVNTQYVVPLYRQDQLQEMMIDHFNKTVFEGGDDRVIRLTIHGQLQGFTDHIYQKDDPPVFTTNIFNSQEQLWLAFVMKELHGKVWDEEKEEWR